MRLYTKTLSVLEQLKSGKETVVINDKTCYQKSNKLATKWHLNLRREISNKNLIGEFDPGSG